MIRLMLGICTSSILLTAYTIAVKMHPEAFKDTNSLEWVIPSALPTILGIALEIIELVRNRDKK